MYDMPRGKRPPMTRLKLTTNDLATLFNVQQDTIRHWISQGKLTFTGDSVQDFKTLSQYWSERSELQL